MSLGLVVEGGGVRAIYAAGVLDTLHDLHLPIKAVIGVSAGAIHGCSFVSGQKGRSLRFYLNYVHDPRFFSFKTLVRTGNIVDTQFCYHDIPEKLDPFDEDAFTNSPMAFYVTCTNVETGEPEYIRMRHCKEEIDTLRASASLPYVSEIVEVNGKKLLDGGCSDRIPVKAFQSMGFDKCIVVLTHPENHVVKDCDAALVDFFYRRYPAFCKTFKNSPKVYEQTQLYIREQIELGNLFVIRPNEPIPAGRLTRDKAKIQAAYDMGVRDAKAQIEALCQWCRNF